MPSTQNEVCSTVQYIINKSVPPIELEHYLNIFDFIERLTAANLKLEEHLTPPNSVFCRNYKKL